MFQLDLTNDGHAAAIAQAAVLAAAAQAGLAQDKTMRLELAVEEVVVNAVHHAYPPGESGKIRVSAKRQGSAFIVQVEDWGLPYDAAEIARYSVEDPELSGLGLHLAWNACDEAVFHNRGRDGKMFELRFRLPASAMPEAPPEPEPEPAAAGRRVVLPALEVRPFAPADATGVARCAWLAYGFTKPDNHLYDTAELVRLNATGEMASLVAAGADGAVYGHACLDFSANARVPEFTDLVIAPAARSNPLLMARMLEEGSKIAVARGCLGVVAGAVTAHTMSQRGALRFGGVPVSVHLASVSTEWELSGADAAEGARQSEITIYMPGPAGPGRTLFCPERHREAVAGIYAALKEPARFADAGAMPPLDAATELSIESGLLAWGHILIDVRRLGRDAGPAVAGFLRRFCIAGAATVLLQLRLADPATAEMAEGFERLGFSFSGVLPNAGREGHDDLIIYQYLNNVTPDVAHEKVANACRPLYDHVLAERRRVDIAVFGAAASAEAATDATGAPAAP